LELFLLFNIKLIKNIIKEAVGGDIEVISIKQKTKNATI
jgi:hypothetical protein